MDDTPSESGDAPSPAEDPSGPPRRQPEPRGEKTERLPRLATARARPVSVIPSDLRGFLDLTGGSLLYVLSAFSILYGISEILGPLLVKPAALRDALPCIGALNGYELALLGTLAFIVVWRHVTDDAISLVTLIPLFLIGSGIALCTVAGANPRLTAGLGAGCAAAGLGILLVLRRPIGLSLGGLSMAGLALVVIWSFLADAVLFQVFDVYAEANAARRDLWRVNFLPVLAGGILALAGAVRSKAQEEAEAGPPRPFLRTVPMACLFSLVLLAAAGAHLYATGYIFSVPLAAGDFLLLFSLLSLLAAEALLGSGSGRLIPAACAVSVPLAVALAGLGIPGFFDAPFAWGPGILGHPALVFGATGGAAVWLAARTRWPGFWAIAGACAIGVTLTAGVTPGGPEAWNWRTAVGGVAAFLGVRGMVLKRAPGCLVAVLLGVVDLLSLDAFQRTVTAAELSREGAAAGLVGAGFLAVRVLLNRKPLLPVAVVGAAALAFFAFDYVRHGTAWRDVHILAVLAVAIALVWWRTREILPVLILCVPAVARAWVFFRDLSAWRYVVLSFVLLGAGAWRSSIKGRKAA
jgi:hypothetical protein